MTKVVALAGGVGGAKLAKGLYNTLSHEELTIIVNTGDDFQHFGLNISPDLDTVIYNLANMSNEITGWGQRDDTWNTMGALNKIDSETWFNLGDKDLATHLERTRLFGQGKTKTEVALHLCKKFSVKVPVLPMTDDPVQTMILCEGLGLLSFQEYFVKHNYSPKMIGYEFVGIKEAKLNPIAEKALVEANVVILCPSNPWLSLFPILSIVGVKEILKNKKCVAVSPIIGNTALKGPAAKIFKELNINPSALEVANLYKDFLAGFILDIQNNAEAESISRWGIIPLVTNIIMQDDMDKERLAKEVVNFAENLR